MCVFVICTYIFHDAALQNIKLITIITYIQIRAFLGRIYVSWF